jgi:hypothetical protein
LLRFEKESAEFSPNAARRRALRFNSARFAEELFTFVDGALTSAGQEPRRAA